MDLRESFRHPKRGTLSISETGGGSKCEGEDGSERGGGGKGAEPDTLISHCARLRGEKTLG